MKLGKEEIILFILIIFNYFYFIGIADWQVTSRIDLTWSIVDYGKFYIDEFHTNTGDKVPYKNHFYSNKAPGPSLLAVPIYFVAKLLMKNIGYDEDTIRFISLYCLLCWMVIGIPTAISSILFYRFLLWFEQSKKIRIIVTITYALTTPIFVYATLFFGHNLGAVFIFISFYLIFLARKKESFKNLFCSGLSAGISFISEYPTGLIIILLSLYVLLVKKGGIFIFLLGILPSIIILMVYHYICFDNPFTLARFYPLEAVEIKEEKEFILDTKEKKIKPERTSLIKLYWGLLIPKLPTLDALYGITLSPYRGLFYTSPILLLGILGLLFMMSNKEYRFEALLTLFIILSFFYYISTIDWIGGYTAVCRRLIPIIPFLSYPIIFVIIRFKIVFLLLFTISYISMLLINAIAPLVPTDIKEPLLFCGELAVNGVFRPNLSTYFGLSNISSIAVYLTISFGIIYLLFKK